MRLACITRAWCKSRRWRLLATATNCPTRDRLVETDAYVFGVFSFLPGLRYSVLTCVILMPLQPFAKVSQKDIEHFTSILGPEGVVTDGATMRNL